jgi:hypothetical protein
MNFRTFIARKWILQLLHQGRPVAAFFEAGVGGTPLVNSCSVIVPGTPDFLSRLVALSNSMRLSLKKAAHAVLSVAA